MEKWVEERGIQEGRWPQVEKEEQIEPFFRNGWQCGLFPSNFTGKLKITIGKAPILLFHKNIEVGANFIFFDEAELVKLGTFGK
jgi:hypothetical protein